MVAIATLEFVLYTLRPLPCTTDCGRPESAPTILKFGEKQIALYAGDSGV